MKKYYKETYIKIGVIGFMIIGVIFMGSYQKANSGFNISDMSIMNSQEKFEAKESEIPKNQNVIPIISNSNSTVLLNVSSSEIFEKMINNSSLEEKYGSLILPVFSSEVNEKDLKSEKIVDIKSNDGVDKLKSVDLNNTQVVTESKNINEADKNIIENAEKKNAEIVQEKESPIIKVVNSEKENFDNAKEDKNIIVQINDIEEGKKEISSKSDDSFAKEDTIKENKETKKNETIKVKIESAKNLKENLVERNISYFNLLIVIFTIIINLMVYYYVYQHLSTNINQNIYGLKKEFIELEESFSYRSITDI